MGSDEAVASSSGEVLVPGARLAERYELVRTLGSGGMGVVWEAKHTESGERCALKFLKTASVAVVESGPDGPESVRRFLREARAAASVKHPHVVAVRELLEPVRGAPVLVMELLSGESLRDHLRHEKRLTIQQAANLLLPVASAVGTAHERGIIHRDLKPDNIFLSRDADGKCVVKVLDFGIAKVTRVDSEATQSVGLTATGEVLGTPNYMAPEQVFGERDIDQRADIWALGVILYECLAGKVPTEAANVGQVFKLIVAGGIKPIEEAAPGVPADVVGLVRRMLARVRTQRPSSLLEVVEVLERYADVSVPEFGAPQVQSSRGAQRDLVLVSSSQLPIAPAGEDAGSSNDANAAGDTARIASTTSIRQGQLRKRSRAATAGTGLLLVLLALAGTKLMSRPRGASSASDAAPATVEPTPSPPALAPPVPIEPAANAAPVAAPVASVIAPAPVAEPSASAATPRAKPSRGSSKPKESENPSRPAATGAPAPLPGNIFEKPPF